MTMPYLSRVWLNPRRENARRFLRNPQAMHAAVLAGFVDRPAGGRVLWRLQTESVPDGAGPLRAELLILSPLRPSLTHIVEQAGFIGADGAEPMTRDYQPLLDRIERDGEFAFRVRVNPTQSLSSPQAPTAAQSAALKASEARSRGFRLPHRTVAQQVEWFIARTMTRWGFVVPTAESGAPDMRVVERGRFEFTKRSAGSGNHRVQIQTATLEGRLRVVDPGLLSNALLSGIGPAKAYGCGLITLAPLRSAAASDSTGESRIVI